MIKILLLALILFIVYVVFFKKKREKDNSKKNNKKQDQITDIMLECPKCGTYISKDDAILSNGKYFCSEACLS